MEIYKKTIGLGILSLLMMGCWNISRQEKESHTEAEYADLALANKNLRDQISDQQNLLDTWFEDFVEIKQKLDSIDTEGILLMESRIGRLETGLPEGFPMNDKDLMLEKLAKIKRMLDQKEGQMQYEDHRIEGMVQMVQILRQEIATKENIILLLQAENTRIYKEKADLQGLVHMQNDQMDSLELAGQLAREKLILLQEKIRLVNMELKKKYVMLVSNREAQLFELHDPSFPINHKLKDVEILSKHLNGTYQLRKYGDITWFHIVNEAQFWSGTKHLIIKIKKKNL